ncbi:MAG: hypothetical protein K8S99_07465 [Planctomycetes bacterium]|nr:hypothetical protein [Planctomycetota bacterium]
MPRRIRRRPPLLFKLVALTASLSLSLLVAELLVRRVDGFGVWSLRLRQERAAIVLGGEDGGRHVERMPVPPGVSRGWYLAAPPPLARKETDSELQRLYDSLPSGMSAIDATKWWNRRFVQAEMANKQTPGGFFAKFPDEFYVFDPVEPSPHPRYRYPPGVTLPSGLVTNQWGFRGPPIDLNKPPRTVRIACVGASTTVDAHGHPFSYPEYLSHWLTLWAAANHPGVKFEVINAGREGIQSPDIAAIVRQEVVPLEPDIVLYYEGSNQFGFMNLLKLPPGGAEKPPEQRGLSGEAESHGALGAMEDYSALARRVGRVVGGWTPGAGEEPAKPDYTLRWPQGVDENNPDLGSPNLPTSLPRILADLDDMRASLKPIGAELMVASFIWMVRDGMVLDPARDKYLLEYMNQTWWPYRYRDMRRMADFQNRVFEKYAAAHGLAFLGVAGDFPFDPSLFNDAIHTTPGGTRLRAWTVFLRLVPLLEERLKSGQLPRPDRVALREHPGLPPARLVNMASYLGRPVKAVPPPELEMPLMQGRLAYKAEIAGYRDGVWTIRGNVVGRYHYLLKWRSERAKAPVRLVAQGVLRHGGLTLGLLSNGKWGLRGTVTTPGPFTLTIPVNSEGPFEVVVASDVPENDPLNDFEITRLSWVHDEPAGTTTRP